jgi:hypothetical protein
MRQNSSRNVHVGGGVGGRGIENVDMPLPLYIIFLEEIHPIESGTV